MEKKIICLANSRKISGRCIAGKNVSIYDEWIRPVSERHSEEISEEERRYSNGVKPKHLDIIKIQFKEYKPNIFQTENYLIDTEYYWEKQGEFLRADLDKVLDSPDSLWAYHNSSYWGVNDRIPESSISSLDKSLFFIKANCLITVEDEGAHFGNSRRKVRCKFKYNNKEYRLPVTDPIIEGEYLAGADGGYDKGKKYMCISLGMPYNGYAYMFVASII